VHVDVNIIVSTILVDVEIEKYVPTAARKPEPASQARVSKLCTRHRGRGSSLRRESEVVFLHDMHDSERCEVYSISVEAEKSPNFQGGNAIEERPKIMQKMSNN
jgi:hypothetical protein